MSDNTLTGTYRLDLPKDLLAEAERVAQRKDRQLRVEGWRRSWLSRLTELLVGKD